MKAYSSFKNYIDSLPTATLFGLSFVSHMLLFQMIIMPIGNMGMFTPNVVLFVFALSLAPVLYVITARLKFKSLGDRDVIFRSLISIAVLCALVWYTVSGFSLSWDVRAYHQPKIFYALSQGDISLPSFSTPRETSIFSSFDYYLTPYLLLLKSPFWISLPVAISVFLMYGAIIDIFESLELNKFGAWFTILGLTLNPQLLHEFTLIKNHLVSALIFTLVFAVWARARKNVKEDNNFFHFDLIALQILGLSIFGIKSLIVIPTFVITIILIIDLWVLRYKNKTAPSFTSVLMWQVPFGLAICLLVALPILTFGEPSKSLVTDWVNIPPNPICGVEMAQYWFKLNISDLPMFDFPHDPNVVNKNCAGNPGLVHVGFNPLFYTQAYYSLWFWLGIISLPLVFLKGEAKHKLCFILPFVALFLFESVYKNAGVNARLWIIFMVPSLCICCHFLASELKSYARYLVLFGFALLMVSNAITITKPLYLRHSTFAFEKASKDFSLELKANEKVYLAISRRQSSSELLDNLYLIMEELDWDWSRIKFGQLKRWRVHHASGWGIGDDTRFTHHLQCAAHRPNADFRLLKQLKRQTVDTNIEIAKITRKKGCKLTRLRPSKQ